MKIITVGCSNAFSEKNYNQSFLLEENGRRLLIDCGFQVPNALRDAGIDFKTIDDIYISHLHADHIGGLEYFAFLRYDWAHKPRKAGLRLIGNTQLINDLWNKSLRGGLESMEGGFVATIDTFFQVKTIEPNQLFDWEGWTVDLVQQIHVMSGSIIIPSFGLIFSRPGSKSIYFVTDSQHCSTRQMEDFYEKADVIFQDCECTGVDTRLKEGESYFEKDGKIVAKKKLDSAKIAEYSAAGWKDKEWKRFKFGTGVRANYAQLAGYNSANSIKLSNNIKKKMWLSHYQDFVLSNKDMYGNDFNWDEEVKNEGFAGLVKRQMTFEF